MKKKNIPTEKKYTKNKQKKKSPNFINLGSATEVRESTLRMRLVKPLNKHLSARPA